MLAISPLERNEFENFYMSSFGDDGDIFDDISLLSYDSNENNSTDGSLTSHESRDSSDSSVGPRAKKQRKINVVKKEVKSEKAYELTPEIIQWQQLQYAQTNIPKIVKTDIRRNYASMLNNVLNTLDFPLLFSFFSTFCTRSIIHSQIFGENREPEMPERFKLNGLQPVTQFWFNKMITMPDCIFELYDTKIHSYSNTGSTKVVSRMVMHSTKLFDLPFAWVLPDTTQQKPLAITAADQLFLQKTAKMGTKRPFQMEESLAMIDTTIVTLVQNAKLLKTPMSFTCAVELTMYINSDKLIEKMEITADRK